MFMSCRARHAANAHSGDGFYPTLLANGSVVPLLCDMTNGGWTRVYDNPFTSDRTNATFQIDCPCSATASMNNGANALDPGGWQLGVTQCHNGNQLSDTISGASASYSFRMHFGYDHVAGVSLGYGMLDIGAVSAVRHTGEQVTNYGYDHGSWASATLTTSSVFANNGEFMSAYRNVDGNWMWMAYYGGPGSFDVFVNQSASYPYFTFLYSGGGPGGCDQSNSDGFDIRNYAVWVM